MSQNKNQAVSKATDLLIKPLGSMTANRDMLFAAGVCLVLAMFFVPLPAILLDFGLTLSFTFSILILMVALWVNKPLEFSSFPSILLIVTVFRLALNVASSRLILSEGHTGTDAAGSVIQGIANFAIGGDYIIGVIVFAILIAINFIVITKGSGRIAEVSARFSLDSMPGKQMAIDADLGSGAIDDEEAKRRRKEVEGESSFFGAMDGAAKFVRGDAVAGIIITLINIVGGILIGAVRHDMSIVDALRNFTILTVGDGLVTQIPALIVSIAAGIIITKGSNEGAASEAVINQLGASPKALYASGIIVAMLGLLPGFPLFFFVPLGLIIVGFGLVTTRTQSDALAEKHRLEEASAKQVPTSESASDMIKTDAIRLDLGSGLVMLTSDEAGVLPGKIKSLRSLFAAEFGFILPPVRIKDDHTLATTTYQISIHDVVTASGEIVMGSRLVIGPPEHTSQFNGKRVKEPAFGLDAIWIDESSAAEAEALGLTVVDAESVMTTHITEVIKGRMSELMTYGTALELVKSMDKDYQKLIHDIPHGSPIILLQKVLQNLLSERVSIKSLPLICEAIAEAAPVSKNPVVITEHVRRKLAAQICNPIQDAAGYLPVITLGPSWSSEFASAIKSNGDDQTCTMSPKRVEAFVLAARIELQKFAAQDQWPALLVSPEARPTIRSMLERVSPNTPVISHAEMHRSAKPKNLATIGD